MTTATVGVALGVVVAAGLAVAAERAARTSGLARARRRLAARLGTDRVGVEVPERPLLRALWRGTGVQVRARDVPVGVDGRLRELAAQVDDVRVDVRRRALRHGPGRFTATVDEAELGRVVRLPGIVTRLEVRATGLRVWTLLAVPVDAEVLVADGALVVVPDPVQVRRLLELPGLAAFRRALAGEGLRLPLPPLPFDAVLEELRFTDGGVEVAGRLPPGTLHGGP